MSFLSNILTGVSLGSIYAIIALGYTMVYGIAKMLNFAHGDVIMVGAFMCFFATGRYGLPPLVSVLLAVVVCTALGIIIEGLAYKPLREAPSLAVLITAIGVSYLLQNGAQLLWGADTKTFTPIVSGSLSLAGGRLNISYVSLLAMACCLVVMVCLTFFTNRTRMGKAMRACSEDKGAAQLMGINVNSTISMTFAIGSALAAGGRGPYVLCLPRPFPHHRLPPRHPGLYRRRVRGHRLHPWGLPGGHPFGNHRDLCQGVHLHRPFRRGGLRGADHRAVGQACRAAGQICARKSVR